MPRKQALPLIITFIAIAAAPEGASAKVVDCDDRVFDTNVIISSSRNMSCRKAVKEMRRYRGSIVRRFETPGGFSCTRQSGSTYVGQWRCVNGRRAYRFKFAD